MQPLNDHRWNVRAVLESTQTPFAVIKCAARTPVFCQGDACDTVMYIACGRVWLSVAARNGKEAICGLLGPGAFLGEEALAGHAVRRQRATAMTPTEVLVVQKAQMIRLLRTQAAIADRFIAHMLARNSRLEADLTDQLLLSCEQRLARTLLLLAGCETRGSHRGVLPGVSQEIIAEMVGSTRSRVNTFMGKFKKLGFIEARSGALHVIPSRLSRISDGDRGISTDVTLAISPALRSVERQFPLAG